MEDPDEGTATPSNFSHLILCIFAPPTEIFLSSLVVMRAQAHQFSKYNCRNKNVETNKNNIASSINNQSNGN